MDNRQHLNFTTYLGGFSPFASGRAAPQVARTVLRSGGTYYATRSGCHFNKVELNVRSDGSKCALCFGLSYVPIEDMDNERESPIVSLDRLAAA